MSQTETFLKMLFEPEETFEVRIKQHGMKGAAQTWLTGTKVGMFSETHVPIHEAHKRNVFVGVCPRVASGKTVASHGRVLWVDLAEHIDSVDRAREALSKSELPEPTMIVWSGNGVHLYWKLERAYPPDVLRLHSKAVHDALPSDATHDPTRVMRVPGTKNFKDPDNPKPCEIIEYHEDRTYPLSEFPKIEPNEDHPAYRKPRQMTELADEDRDSFITAFVPGQRHYLAVGIAGYLRKDLYYDEHSCLQELGRIAQAAGAEWPDPNIDSIVRDTYKQMFGKVVGASRLHEYGVFPKVRDSFNFSFSGTPKPKPKLIEIIDFDEEIDEQEFWMDGLIGPGMLTIWAASPKVGKSFAAMQIGHALASGHNIWDFNVHGAHRVLYFQGELSKGMVYGRAKGLFGLQAVRNPKQFALTGKPAKVFSLSEQPEILNDLAEHYDVIIVDPISAFNANDENSSSTVRDTLSVFDALRDAGKAVMIVHHTKKLETNRDGTPVTPSFNDIRGNGAWFAGVDAAAIQYLLGDTGNTRVKFMFRAAPERDPLDLYRMPHGGFTHDREAYLKTVTSFKSDVSAASIN